MPFRLRYKSNAISFRICCQSCCTSILHIIQCSQRMSALHMPDLDTICILNAFCHQTALTPKAKRLADVQAVSLAGVNPDIRTIFTTHMVSLRFLSIAPTDYGTDCRPCHKYRMHCAPALHTASRYPACSVRSANPVFLFL